MLLCILRSQKLSWTKRLSHALHSAGETQGYSTVGESPPPLHGLSLPTHTFLSESDEDLIISPYASYTSLTERAPPIISGWLDKLSPQGWVKFTHHCCGFVDDLLSISGSLGILSDPGCNPSVSVRYQLSAPAFLLHLLLSAPPCVSFLLRSCLCLTSSSSSFSPSSSTRSVCLPSVFFLLSATAGWVEFVKLNSGSVNLFFRNYVFQKRYVKFDGKNLMYFGSEKVWKDISSHHPPMLKALKGSLKLALIIECFICNTNWFKHPYSKNSFNLKIKIHNVDSICTDCYLLIMYSTSGHFWVPSSDILSLLSRSRMSTPKGWFHWLPSRCPVQPRTPNLK